MKTKANVFLFILLAFFLVRAEAYADHFEIIAFGDSLTQGLKRSAAGLIWAFPNPANGLRIGGYAPHLERLFKENTTHTACVYNWGYGGERTTTAVNRISFVLRSRPANYLLLLEGANDLYEGLSASTTRFNIGVMVDKCRAKKVGPILATVTPNTRHPKGYQIPNMMNPQIVSLARAKNVPLADLYSALGGNWGQYSSGDGLHWSDAGDKRAAQVWLKTLEPFLPKEPLPVPIEPEPASPLNIVPILELLLF